MSRTVRFVMLVLILAGLPAALVAAQEIPQQPLSESPLIPSVEETLAGYSAAIG